MNAAGMRVERSLMQFEGLRQDLIIVRADELFEVAVRRENKLSLHRIIGIVLRKIARRQLIPEHVENPFGHSFLFVIT